MVFSLDSGSGTVELESRPWFLGSESAWLVVVSRQSAVVSVYFTVLNPFVLCSGCLYLSILQVYFLFCNKWYDLSCGQDNLIRHSYSDNLNVELRIFCIAVVVVPCVNVVHFGCGSFRFLTFTYFLRCWFCNEFSKCDEPELILIIRIIIHYF